MKKSGLFAVVMVALVVIIPLGLSASTSGPQVSPLQMAAPVQFANPNLFNLPGAGRYADALSDAASQNQGIDAINKAECAAKGTDKQKAEDSCDKDNLKSKSELRSTGEGTKEFKKLPVKELSEVKGNAQEAPEVCGYNEGCKKVAEEFPQKYDDALKACCEKAGTCIPPTPPSTIWTCTVTGCDGSHEGTGSDKQSANKMAVQTCKQSPKEHKKANEKASDPSNEKGKDETKKKQECGKKPQANELTTQQQEHCLYVIKDKCECNEVKKVATENTISRLSTSDQALILGLTTKCPSVDGLNCGPWDKCHKSTVTKSNCALGSKGIDSLLPDNCGINSGTPQLKSSNYAIADKCGGTPKC